MNNANLDLKVVCTLQHNKRCQKLSTWCRRNELISFFSVSSVEKNRSQNGNLNLKFTLFKQSILMFSKNHKFCKRLSKIVVTSPSNPLVRCIFLLSFLQKQKRTSIRYLVCFLFQSCKIRCVVLYHCDCFIYGHFSLDVLEILPAVNS